MQYTHENISQISFWLSTSYVPYSDILYFSQKLRVNMGIQFNAKNILKVPQCLKIVELVRYFPFIILNQNQYIFAKLYIIFFSFYRCYPSFVCCLHELEIMEKIHCLLPQILMPAYQVDLSFTDIFSLQLSKLLVFCVVKSHQFWYSKYLTLQKHIFTIQK